MSYSEFGRFARVTLPGVTADWVGSEEPLEALHVSRGRAVALIHVAATDAFRLGRHADLIAHSIVTDRRSQGVTAVAEVIARLR